MEFCEAFPLVSSEFPEIVHEVSLLREECGFFCCGSHFHAGDRVVARSHCLCSGCVRLQAVSLIISQICELVLVRAFLCKNFSENPLSLLTSLCDCIIVALCCFRLASSCVSAQFLFQLSQASFHIFQDVLCDSLMFECHACAKMSQFFFEALFLPGTFLCCGVPVLWPSQVPLVRPTLLRSDVLCRSLFRFFQCRTEHLHPPQGP